MPQIAAAAQCSEHPPWVLLDTDAHIGCCKNATTATAKTSAADDIVVSFSVTHPPALSSCFVHCPDLTDEIFSGQPCVTGADGALVLIRVTFAERHGKGRFTDIFVYRAGPGEPSLDLVPRPYPVLMYLDHVGFLSCGEHYFIVIPEPRFETYGRMDYDLRIFSSETMSWSTKVAPVAVDGDTDYDLMARHEPNKVISIGGVWLGWVDLRRGILLCNVVDKLPEMRLIQLPSLMPTNKADFGEGFDGAMPPLGQIRDVTFRNGLISFVEIEYPDLNDSNLTEFRWMATMFTREICSENWDWCCTVDSADLLPTDTCSHDLFPEFWDCEAKKLTWNKVISSAPTLDLYDEDVMYMMARLNADDPNRSVLAVNTRNKTLSKVAPFAAESSFYLLPTYQQCSFTKYLSKDQGTDLATVKKCTNRGMIELLDKYLLDALDQIKDIASSLDANDPTMQITEHGLNIGRDKDAANAVECLRVIREIELHISAPIDATKSKIRIAHDALYNLMLALPSEVLDEVLIGAKHNVT